MKKLLGFIVLGLLLQSCATPVGQDTSMQKEKNWVASTLMSPKSGFKDALIGASWGLYTPHLYDFYAYGESKEEAEDRANNKCKNFRKEKNWETKAKCNPVTSYLTEKGKSLALDDERKKQAKAEAKASGDLTFTIKDKKEQCTAIGFAPATEKFADCVLRLVELDVKSQQTTQITLAQSQGNLQVAEQLKKQNNSRSSDAFIDLGLKLLSPQSTVSAPSTSTCRVIGSGAYKTVNCW